MIRLAVNINEDVSEVLRRAQHEKGWTATEAVRQAISLMNFAMDTEAKGGQLATVSRMNTVHTVTWGLP